MNKVIIIQKQHVKTFFTGGQTEIIKQFTRWVDGLPYKHHIKVAINAIISDVPYEETAEHEEQDTHPRAV
jgi:hypothetical protein